MTAARRTKPTFLLTNAVDITVIRAGEIENVMGKPVVGEPTEHEIRANIQPLKFTELMTLPESDRTKEWIKGFCDPSQDIRGAREGSDGWEADRVVWEGDKYKVVKIQRWKMGVLDHISFHAVREPISAGGW